ncbi:SixA phosphatase family protein [Nocardioides litoris]|uniref:SixA phosphatase family protein n=1 Tax=Nocardioides litoris TaxID=1926648 RepID=UPI001120E929|nr:histidine phosphatase family protein [Nocardioides litoris]
MTAGQAGARTLVVMRHAKAEPDGPSDFERALAQRGHGDAVAAGAWLAESGVEPEHALVSAALRTRQTWEHVCRGAGWSLEPELDRGLYAAGVDTAIDLLRLLDDDVTTAVVVGHNPTMHSLATTLDDAGGDTRASTETAIGGFPTSATVVLAVPGSWSDLGPGGASVVAYHVGRG